MFKTLKKAAIAAVLLTPFANTASAATHEVAPEVAMSSNVLLLKMQS